MAYNWTVLQPKVAGTNIWYVWPAGGSDANNGSAVTPFASINAATTAGSDNDTIVLAENVYQEARGTSTNKYHFVADGEVIFNLETRDKYFVSGENINNLTLINNVNLNITSNGGVIFINKCKVEFLCNYQGTLHITNSIIFGIKPGHPDMRQAYSTHVFADNTTFLNVYRCSVTYRGAISWDRINNCIVQNANNTASNIVGSVSYCIFNNIDSSFLENAIESKVAIPHFVNQNVGNYLLHPYSPCLGAGKNGANIGAFGLGFNFNANSSEATEEAGAVYSQSDVGNGLENDIIRVSQLLNGVNHYLFKLQSGHSAGTVKFAKIDLGASYEIEAIRLFKNFLYNASGQATASADNLTTNNVADFQLKFWNLDSEEATATTKEFRWEEIREDNSGNGNASTAYSPAQAKRITFRYAELTMTLRAS